jgi:hypothetical protein
VPLFVEKGLRNAQIVPVIPSATRCGSKYINVMMKFMPHGPLLIVFGTLGGVLICSRWLFVAAFGLWLRPRVDIRSWPYLALYWLLQFPLLEWLNGYLVTWFVKPGPLLSWLKNFGTPALYGSRILENVASVLVVLLVLSESTALLKKAGVEVDNKSVALLLALRKFGFFLGLSAACLAALGKFLWLVVLVVNRIV